MITAKEELNRIFWDKKENKKEYTIDYFDRVEKKNIKMPFSRIKKVEGTFMELEDETSIPLHRIRKIRKNGKLIWERKIE